MVSSVLFRKRKRKGEQSIFFVCSKLYKNFEAVAYMQQRVRHTFKQHAIQQTMSAAAVNTTERMGGAGAAAATATVTTDATAIATTDLLTTFGLEKHGNVFARVVHDTRAFISGGSALYWWMNTQATTPSMKTSIPYMSDLDIWLPIPFASATEPLIRANGIYDFKKVSLLAFELVLNAAGYVRQAPSGEDYSSCYTAKYIQSIHTFKHPTLKRKIQIIAIFDCKSPLDIVRTFDFDICSIVLRGVGAGDGTYALKLMADSVPPHAVERICREKSMRLGMFFGEKPALGGILMRLEKYYSRGFALEVPETPCSRCRHVDAEFKRLATYAEARIYVRAKFGAHM
jgi:hypothetical protein